MRDVCPSCTKEITWVTEKRGSLYEVASVGGFFITYKCQLCQRERLAVVVRKIVVGTAVKGVHKIGQFPPQSIDIPPELEGRLGSDGALYKNALICRNHNFGVGALAYMRRIVENKANELIEVVATQAASLGVGAEDVAKIREAKDDKITFDERLRLASEAIPSTMKPDGANPLAAIHGLLSNGLHAKSEQECLEIADEIRDVFECVFARLHAEIEDRETMVAKIEKFVGTREQ
jgi:hypothetical protein